MSDIPLKAAMLHKFSENSKRVSREPRNSTCFFNFDSNFLAKSSRFEQFCKTQKLKKKKKKTECPDLMQLHASFVVVDLFYM